jgi:hypothetical protein
MLDLDHAFDRIAEAMKRAAAACSHRVAADEAQLHGLVEQGSGRASTKYIWERSEGDKTLRFQWRYYDQSHAYRTYPDMNVLSVELSEAGKVLRSAEERYED